jgi:exodeoxyribonuclease VII small subunit
MAEEKIKFEKALERLEEIVAMLESGDMELEKSLKVFEEGIKMARVCQVHLSHAEKKIEKLVKDHKGELTTETMEAASSPEVEGEPDDGVPF